MGTPGIDRRSVLAKGALTVAGAAVALSNDAHGLALAAPSVLTLPKVDVVGDRVTRKIAALRPFRPSGFVVRQEPLGDKTLIHNYGHGGCGVTLSWGTADMAASLAVATPHREAAVLGCGAVGLATARLLQDRGFAVEIYAKDIPPNTTSNVAAAMFGVTEVVSEEHRTGPIVEQIQKAARFAHRYFQTFISARYGVRWVEFFLIGDRPQAQPWDFAITPELYPLTMYLPGEHPFPTAYASSFPTMMIESGVYLRQLLDDFLIRGGKLHARALPNPTAVSELDAPLVVNCTGLGSKQLFGDSELVPLKGQLTFLLPQPEVTYAYLDGAKDLYMFPRDDAIILGGSHQKGVWSTEPDPDVAARILLGHQKIIGGMR